ncbi:MAG: NAD(P)/FAD-dependent oxidoreductase, partial [archaeon]
MVLIIGAGPAGLFAGENIGGCKILEEHKDVGVPAQCGGLLSRSGLEELKVLDKYYVLNEIRGADFYSKSRHFSISKGETVAYSVCRVAFDQYLAKRAEKRGCTIETGCRVSRIEQKGRTWVAKTSSGDYEDETLVLACGNSLNLISQAGFEPYKPQNLLKTIQADCRMPSERDKVALYFSREYTDCFFAWTIPAGDFVRVGVGSFSDAPQKFEAFLKKLGAKPESKFAGVIPIKGALKRTQSSNAYLVGDAAGQVKPTTGGG